MTKIQAIFSLLLVAVVCLSAQEIEVTGEVVSVDEVPYQNGNIYILQAQIRTQNQEMVQAELGPPWFLENDVVPGDEITVRGKYLEANRIRVREMIHNRIATTISDEDYAPLWLRTRLQERNHIYDPRTEKTAEGDVTDIYIEETSSMMEAKVKARNGELMTVRIAPEWYLGSMVRMGDELAVRGSAVKDNGGTLIMAREMRNLRLKREIRLRDAQGFPEWHRSMEEHQRRYELERKRRDDYGGTGNR